MNACLEDTIRGNEIRCERKHKNGFKSGDLLERKALLERKKAVKYLRLEVQGSIELMCYIKCDSSTGNNRYLK